MATQNELLQEAQATIKAMQKQLERIAEAGLQYSTILAVEGKYAITSSGKGYTYATNQGFAKGDTVLTHPGTGQVVEKVTPLLLGDVCVVESNKDGLVRLTSRGETKVVSPGKIEGLKRGDFVLLDPSDTTVIHVVERAKAGKPVEVAPVRWDDIGGHTEAKAVLREAIELPYQHPRVFKHYGKKQPKGILLHGEPGCGKTMLGRAVATSTGADGGFFSIKGPSILNEYVGVSERAVRTLFRNAADHKETTGKPAVIFIDECEAILAVRGGHHSYMEKTIVPAFLTEMDGLEESAAIVILSTNRADMLDPAVVREGRIDYKVKIKRPDLEEAKVIFDIHLSKAPVNKGVTREKLINYASGRLYDAPKLPHSGALIAGTVEKAITHAIRRDIATGRLTGLCEQDLEWATQRVIEQEALA